MQKVEIPNKEKLIQILRANHITYAALFGSRAKGIARPDSDYDLMVEFDRHYPIPLSRFVKVEDVIEKAVSSKVDLITTRGTNKRLHDEIDKTKVVLYDERRKNR